MEVRVVLFQAIDFVLLFPLHASILEPYFDLSFGEVEQVGDFHSPAARQVPAEVEFLLQFQGLVPSVRRPSAFRVYPVLSVCRQKENSTRQNATNIASIVSLNTH